MSELTGNGFLAGASASAINEMVQKKLSEQFEGEPDKHQWASAIIGSIVSQLTSGNAQAGASTAASGTKNNELLTEDEIIKIMFSNGRAEEYLKQKGVAVNEENIYALKAAIKEIYDNSIDSDAIMLSYGATFSTDITYDLKDKTTYMSNGASIGEGSPAGCSLVSVKLIVLDDTIDINDPEIRRNIFTGQSFTVSGFLAVGGGLSFPVNSPYSGKVKVLIKGIGTPQIGAGSSSTETIDDRANRLYNNAISNPYGSD